MLYEIAYLKIVASAGSTDICALGLLCAENMAPVTRSSLQGRSISREGSWQIPTEDDLPSEQAADGDGERVGDDTMARDHPDEGSDDDQLQASQGISLRLTILGNLSMKTL